MIVLHAYGEFVSHSLSPWLLLSRSCSTRAPSPWKRFTKRKVANSFLNCVCLPPVTPQLHTPKPIYIVWLLFLRTIWIMRGAFFSSEFKIRLTNFTLPLRILCIEYRRRILFATLLSDSPDNTRAHTHISHTYISSSSSSSSSHIHTSHTTHMHTSSSSHTPGRQCHHTHHVVSAHLPLITSHLDKKFSNTSS